ncbi:ABC transporter substrate-binding protein [uncultured Aureimonas sp.]|uniref:ABC transporter substrate-binding protein n=1 Tax=uncultured Aureimonas sp. TaxID=1604662 RepID=UPI0025F639F3|nr:ABC transporter substrate-binding protein [uncultured Aureimonas sp.]
MKHLLASTVLAIAFGSVGTLAAHAAGDCSEVTVAAMNWQSAEVLASLDKFILEKGYGCEVSVISGDTVPTLTSMAERGQPDIAPEGWVDLVPEVINRGLSEKKLVATGQALSDGAQQGWFIPKYVADAHPDIKTIGDALKHPELFPNPEDPSKGAVFNGPQGWGGTVVTAQFFKAYDAANKGFTLVDTGSSAGLDGSIARANENKQGWLGYYWAPTAILGRYPMVRLGFDAPHDAAEWKRCNSNAECPDPKLNEWAADSVDTVVTTKFAERAGEPVMTYLGKRSWSNATVNELLAWMTDNQANGDDGAKHFLETKKDVWSKWVTPEAASKIEAAL